MLKTPIPTITQLRVLGDTHLGRRFFEGVPINRRGERERRVFEDFYLSLISEDLGPGSVVVQTGDIFDGFEVSPAVVLQTYQLLVAAQEATGAIYIIYRGNHDASRDEGKKSSFDILEALLKDHNYIHVLTGVWNYATYDKNGDWVNFGFMPWHPFKSAAELATELSAKIHPDTKFDVVFTHCDLEQFGEKDHNVMPYEILSKITKAVVNGHIHTPETRVVYDTPFIMVGSMQPYSHGEDPEGDWYVTMTLEEFFKVDPLTLADKNVRFLLEEGESVPDELPDCLSITVKRVKMTEGKPEEDDSEVIMQDFNLSHIILDCLKQAGVGAKIADSIDAKFQESKNAT